MKDEDGPLSGRKSTKSKKSEGLSSGFSPSNPVERKSLKRKSTKSKKDFVSANKEAVGSRK